MMKCVKNGFRFFYKLKLLGYKLSYKNLMYVLLRELLLLWVRMLVFLFGKKNYIVYWEDLFMFNFLFFL